MNIGVANNCLAQIRIAKAMTQEQVFEITEISQSDLSKYENGTARISVEKAIRLADCYGVSLDEIFMRDTLGDHKLIIKNNDQLTLMVEMESGNEVKKLFKLLMENNFVASICKRGSTSN